jgi:D-ribose pyranose/furanose isomerase RbsD
VDVESVRFTDAKIGINGDATMIDLGTTAGMVTVNGDLKATGDLTLTTAAASITHSGGTSLSISSGGFVAVESVQFAGANIGINGDTNLMVLTSGVLTVDGKVASTTLETSGAATVATTLDVGGATNLTNTLDVSGATTLGSTVELLANAATVTHSGTTSLTISSTLGYVGVETVQFTGSQIGISGDTTMIDLGATAGMVTVNGNLKATGDLTLTKPAAAITHSGATSLSISSGGFVDVESVRFTDAKIGINGDATMIDLGTTAGMVTVNGDLKATGDLTLTTAAAAITHSGATSLSISSGGFVDVESVRFTDAKIGINGDATMIDLGTTAGMVTVNGDLKATGDLTLTTAAASITHSGGTSLSISSGGFVAVESVEFAGANIGISGDTNLMVLTSGVLTVDGKVRCS